MQTGQEEADCTHPEELRLLGWHDDQTMPGAQVYGHACTGCGALLWLPPDGEPPSVILNLRTPDSARAGGGTAQLLHARPRPESDDASGAPVM